MTCEMRRVAAVAAFTGLCAVSAASVHGQAGGNRPAAAAPKQVMAEDVFKNVQQLRGISVSEFWDTMGFISAALGANCVHCHVESSLNSLDKFAEDTPRKRRAREMIAMVKAINTTHFGGARIVTCNSCHNGEIRPQPVPSLLKQYSLPIEDPNIVEIVPGTTSPSALDILSRYVRALGGAERLARITSFAAKGTYQGFDTYDQPVPYEVYAKAPNQRTVIVHTQNGDNTTVFDGRTGWAAAVDKPVPLLPLSPGGELDGAELDANLSFPANIAMALSGWRAGFPATSIGDKNVRIIQGAGGSGARIKLFFEDSSGLLVRVVRYTNTLIGIVPTEIDYEDYRDVLGVKMPFKTTVTWTSGQATIVLTDVQPNVAIDGSRFGMPAPAVLKKVGR
jgi:photosynthetic reaction center cytochrome c subunit